MVAEGYSAERRAVAKKLGLGNRGLLAEASTPHSEAPAPEAVPAVKLKSIKASNTVNKSVAASAAPKHLRPKAPGWPSITVVFSI